MEPITIVAIVGVIYSAASEIIGLNPKWKSNSVVQVTLSTVGKLLSIFRVK